MKQFSLKTILKQYKGHIFCIALVMILNAIMALVNPGYAKWVIDSLTVNDISIKILIPLGIVVLIFTSLGVYLRNLVMDLFIKRISFDLSNKFIESLLRHPIRKLTIIGEGKIFTNFSEDMTALTNTIRTGLDLIRIPFEMVLASAYLFYTNWLFGLIVMVLLPPITFMGKKFGELMGKYNEKFLTKNDKQYSLINRILKTINIIKTYRVEKMLEEDFKKLTSEKYILDKKQVKYNSGFKGLMDFAIGIPYFVVYFSSVF